MDKAKLSPTLGKVLWFIGLWTASLMFFLLLACGIRLMLGG
jgi:arginine exporter protein ArgO